MNFVEYIFSNAMYKVVVDWSFECDVGGASILSTIILGNLKKFSENISEFVFASGSPAAFCGI